MRMIRSAFLSVYILIGMTFNLYAQASVETPFTISQTKNSGIKSLELNIKSDFVSKLLENPQKEIRLELPITKEAFLSFNFSQINILSKDYKLTTSDGLIIRNGQADTRFYTGKNSSTDEPAVFALINNQVYTSFIYKGQEFVIEQPSKFDKKTLKYILKRSASDQETICSVTDKITPLIRNNESEAESKNLNRKAAGPVNIYVECDYKMFQDLGSNVLSVETFTTNLFTSVAAIYLSEVQVTLMISEIKVWTSPDPYDPGNSSNSSQVLAAFTCEMKNGYNGRLAHLLSSVSKNHGGIADVKDFCGNSAILVGYSNISLNGIASRLLVAHEIGHNLSSSHTHACAWNGNNTQIDDCGNVGAANPEGKPCYNPSTPIIPANGNMMSYCGNANNSDIVHPQIELKIRNFVNNCLQPLRISCELPQDSDIQISISNDGTSVNVRTNKLSTQFTFLYYFPENGSANCLCDGNISNITTLNGLTPNTNYFLSVSWTCPTGALVSDWSCLIPFKTTPSNCVNNHELSGTISGIFNKAQFINISAATLNPSQTLSLTAKNSISIYPEFTVNKSSILTVQLADCN